MPQEGSHEKRRAPLHSFQGWEGKEERDKETLLWYLRSSGASVSKDKGSLGSHKGTIVFRHDWIRFSIVYPDPCDLQRNLFDKHRSGILTSCNRHSSQIRQQYR